MGAYLSTPVTKKEIEEGESSTLQYGVAAMQGWRRTMEDAHIAALDLDGQGTAAMFGVFDGHGGGEVAKFCQKYMAREILALQQYQEGDVKASLVSVFHKMDDMLRDTQYHDELTEFRGGGRMVNGTAGANSQGAGEGSTGGSSSSNSDDSMLADITDADALGVMKRILEIKRIVTGEDSGGSGGGSVASDTPSVAPGSSGKADSEGADSDKPQGSEHSALVSAPKDSAAPAATPEPLPEHRIQAGCTAVVAVIKGGQIYVANAGDSRAVLARGESAFALSEDHKPAAHTEKQRITTAGGFVSEVGGVTRVNGNLNLSRAIGDLKYKANRGLPAAAQIITAEPDVMAVELTPEDRFMVMACDGVWDVLTNQQAIDFVSERLKAGKSPKEVCSEMLDHCLAKDPKEARGIGCDNMTASVIVLRQPEQAA